MTKRKSKILILSKLCNMRLKKCLYFFHGFPEGDLPKKPSIPSIVHSPV